MHDHSFLGEEPCGGLVMTISIKARRGLPLYFAKAQYPDGSYCSIEDPPSCGTCGAVLAAWWRDFAPIWEDLGNGC